MVILVSAILVYFQTSLEEQEMLAIEEGHFHDVVVADIEEDYYSLSMKTYAMLLYKDTR